MTSKISGETKAIVRYNDAFHTSKNTDKARFIELTKQKLGDLGALRPHPTPQPPPPKLLKPLATRAFECLRSWSLRDRRIITTIVSIRVEIVVSRLLSADWGHPQRRLGSPLPPIGVISFHCRTAAAPNGWFSQLNGSEGSGQSNRQCNGDSPSRL